MSRVIVDASLAVKWVVAEDHAVEALQLLGVWQQQPLELIVPGWFSCECGNVLFQRVRRGAMALADARSALTVILSQVMVWDSELTDAVHAIELAHQLGQRASYDACYLALAERLDCELWTADLRFWNAARGTFPQVRWIGELS